MAVFLNRDLALIHTCGSDGDDARVLPVGKVHAPTIRQRNPTSRPPFQADACEFHLIL